MVEDSLGGEEHKPTTMEEEQNRELLLLGFVGHIGGKYREVEPEVGGVGGVEREVLGEHGRGDVGGKLGDKGARDGAVFRVFDDLQEEIGGRC